MKTVVIKISGTVASDGLALDRLATFIKKLIQSNKRVIITHGGGQQINLLSQRLGLGIRQVAGRRITDDAAREVLLYTVGGKVNRDLVGAMRSNDISAVGISGIDGFLTTSIRRPPIEIDGDMVDFGLVGEIVQTDTNLLSVLLDVGMVPVVGCLTWSEEEGALNINADTFSIQIALSIKANELIMLMEPPAVLDENGEPVERLTAAMWRRGLREGWVTNGMKPKLLNAFKALDSGINRVRLASVASLLENGGTVLVSETG